MDSIRHNFFAVGNLHGIGFLASSGKTIMVSDHRAAKISLLSFHSIVFARAHDQRFPSIRKFIISHHPSFTTASTNLASDFTTAVASLRKKDVLDNLASCLTTGVTSLRKKDVLDNLASGLTTGVTSLRKKNVLDNLTSCLTTGATTLRKKDVLDHLASGLTTGVTSLRKKDILAYTTNSFDLFFYHHPFVRYLLILSQPSLSLQIS